MAIEVLSPQVIDQISAGEVVERPAHLVKELVENSIDAGAQNIEVDFSEGGRQVSIKDDGWGISRNDLSLAVSRHATSKIKWAEDLWSLSTYGFRGEALASISAVSDFNLVSREKHSSHAYLLRCHFGQIDEPVEVGGDQGTWVQVNNLFENIPVRKKFLKSDLAESGQIKQTLKALALSVPHISWKIKTAGELLYFWPRCSSEKERAEQILELSPLYSTAAEEGNYKIKVVYSAPHQVIRNSRQIWLFVRGRWVTDRSLVAAVMESYRNLLMKGEFPVVALWLDVPADDVDVNIHPTKSQVKFRQPAIVFRTIVHVLRSALEKAPWVAEILGQPSSVVLKENSEDEDEDDYKIGPKTLSKNHMFLSFSAPELEKTQFKSLPMISRVEAKKQETERYEAEGYITKNQDKERHGLGDRSVDTRPEEKRIEIKQSEASASWSSLHIIGQAQLTYIVAQSSRSLILIDQHAAHERVIFETLMKTWRGGKKEVQSYLIPLICEFLPEQTETLMKAQKKLETLGIYLQLNSSELMEITAGPALISEDSLITGLQKLTDDWLEQGESFVFDEVVGDLLATLACHSAIRAGQALNIEEMKALLVQMDEFSFSSFCPHGRPVFLDLPWQKVERDFGRLG